MYKRFRESLIAVQYLNMEEQKTKLYAIFLEWKGEVEQVDDLLVIGITVELFHVIEYLAVPEIVLLINAAYFP